jgi:uncharacterized protein YlxW (UPF0749 family)
MAADHQRPPHAVMGLLDYITSTSLDGDYAEVARRRSADPAASTARRTGRPGRLGMVVLALFGVLVATAGVQTARNSAESASSHNALVAQIHDHTDRLNAQRDHITQLRRRVAALRADLLSTSATNRSVQAKTRLLGVLAGSVPVRGPGIQVVVDDAPGGGSGQQVLDKDLQKLVNGLWKVGAEAIAINSQRLSNLSAIREAGNSITVNYRDVNRPYVVSAVGNPNQMGARLLDTAAGQTWLALKSTFGLRFDITSEESMKLPAASRLDLRQAHTRKTLQ